MLGLTIDGFSKFVAYVNKYFLSQLNFSRTYESTLGTNTKESLRLHQYFLASSTFNISKNTSTNFEVFTYVLLNKPNLILKKDNFF